MIIPEYAPFIKLSSEQTTDPDQKDLTLTAMPKKFFAIVHAMLMKHFNQCRTPLLLPLAPGGDAIPAQLLALHLCNLPTTTILLQLYYSEKHHSNIHITNFLLFLTELLPTQEDKKTPPL